jgi:hypothetical protein
MMTLHEVEKLRMILEILKEDPNYCNRPQIDVSHRARDERGRFLPNDFNKQGELFLELSDNDEGETLRKIKLVKIKGTYGTYLVKEKIKISDILMTFGIVISLVIAYLS